MTVCRIRWIRKICRIRSQNRIFLGSLTFKINSNACYYFGTKASAIHCIQIHSKNEFKIYLVNQLHCHNPFSPYQSLVRAGTDLRDAENAFLLPLLLQTGTGTSESDPEEKKNAHGLLLFLVHEQLDYNKKTVFYKTDFMMSILG